MRSQPRRDVREYAELLEHSFEGNPRRGTLRIRQKDIRRSAQTSFQCCAILDVWQRVARPNADAGTYLAQRGARRRDDTPTRC